MNPCAGNEASLRSVDALSPEVPHAERDKDGFPVPMILRSQFAVGWESPLDTQGVQTSKRADDGGLGFGPALWFERLTFEFSSARAEGVTATHGSTTRHSKHDRCYDI